MCALAALATAPALAGDKPAVSGVNGKVEAMGGGVDGESVTMGAASVAVPLGQAFGAQFDAAGGEFSASRVLGAGTHLFWRDPDVALLGIIASRTGVETIWGNRFGVEGEAYLGPVTIAATAGWQNGEFAHTGWGGADLRWYPIDDLMLETGAAAYDNLRTGHVGAEWRPAMLSAMPGLTLFGDAGFGNHTYGHALAGLRIYFGGDDKSLKRRHREDDPINFVVGGAAQAAAPASGGIPGVTTPAAAAAPAASSGGGQGGE